MLALLATLLAGALGTGELRDMPPLARAQTALKVGTILASATVQTVIQEMQQELVHAASFGYTRPLTSRFQQSVGWTDLPAAPGSANMVFAAAQFVAPHLHAAAALQESPLSPASTPARADVRGAVEWVASFRDRAQPALAIKLERDRKLARFSAWRSRLAAASMHSSMP